MKTNLSKEMDSEMLFDLIRKANRDKDAEVEYVEFAHNFEMS